MKKALVWMILILTIGVLVGGCGSTAKETGSSGSYYNNPSKYK